MKEMRPVGVAPFTKSRDAAVTVTSMQAFRLYNGEPLNQPRKLAVLRGLVGLRIRPSARPTPKSPR
jgi:hypothetical protein